MNRVDRRLRRAAGKSDTIDAEAAARAVLAGQATATPKTADGAVEMMRQLKVARDSAVKARTTAMSTLKQILVNAPPVLREPLQALTDRALVTRCAGLQREGGALGLRARPFSRDALQGAVGAAARPRGGHPRVSPGARRRPQVEEREGGRHERLAGLEGAAEVLEQQRPGWRNAKHARDWPRSLRAYAFPRIGAMPVSEVTTADVLAILTPIWHDKPETARRVRQRIGAVMK